MNTEEYLGKTISDKGLEYKLVECMPPGFMGVVYKGVAKVPGNIDKVLAFKFPKDEEFEDHIKKAAEVMENIGFHPNIVQFEGYGVSRDLDTPYLKMEFLDGKDLGVYIADKKKERTGIDPNKTIHIIFQIMDAIEHVHSLDIIHTDLTPSNIRIIKGGVAKVMDFGLAQIIAEISKEKYEEYVNRGTKYYRKTNGMEDEGILVNSSEYIAPEQKKGIFTPQGDIYSIAKLLCLCVTGQDFGDEGVDVEILKEKNWEFMANIIQNGIKTDLDKRYKSVAEMRDAIKKGMMKGILKEFDKVYVDTRDYIQIPNLDSILKVTSEEAVYKIGRQHEIFLKHSSSEKYKGNEIIEEKVKEIDELLKNRIINDIRELASLYVKGQLAGQNNQAANKILSAWKKYPVESILDYCRNLEVEIKKGPIEIDGKYYGHCTLLD